MPGGGRHDPMLCPPGEKAEREAANGVGQIDYLTYLVTEMKVTELRESHVLELQRLAIEEIYPCGGTYRDARTDIRISNSEHVPPESAFVRAHVQEMIDWINSRRLTTPALERAAYALWRLNWIHPFRGGNGRTSRCVAYMIICLDLGLMMPGIPTLPTLIYDRRAKYVEALQAADASVRAGAEEPDLTEMSAYLKNLVTNQLASAITKLASTATARYDS